MNGPIKPLPPQSRLMELFSYDPGSGAFTRKVGVKKGRAGSSPGTISCGYLSIGVDWNLYRAHRLAWMYVTGEDPGEMEVDHINGDRLDNRFSNLRLVNHRDNTKNKKVGRNSKSGIKGVYYEQSRNKFVAEVISDGKKIRLGRYDTEDEAKAAYNAAAKVAHGEFFRP